MTLPWLVNQHQKSKKRVYKRSDVWLIAECIYLRVNLASYAVILLTQNLLCFWVKPFKKIKIFTFSYIYGLKRSNYIKFVKTAFICEFQKYSLELGNENKWKM